MDPSSISSHENLSRCLGFTFPYDPSVDYPGALKEIRGPLSGILRADLSLGSLKVAQTLYEDARKGDSFYFEPRRKKLTLRQEYYADLVYSRSPEVLEWVLTLPFGLEDYNYILKEASRFSQEIFSVPLLRRSLLEGIRFKDPDLFFIAEEAFKQGKSDALTLIADNYSLEDHREVSLTLNDVKNQGLCLSLTRFLKISPGALGEVLLRNTTQKISYPTENFVETSLGALGISASSLLKFLKYSCTDVKIFEKIIKALRDESSLTESSRREILGSYLWKTLKDERGDPPFLEILLENFPDLKEDYDLTSYRPLVHKLKITSPEKVKIYLELFPPRNLGDLLLRGRFPYLTEVALEEYPEFFVVEEVFVLFEREFEEIAKKMLQVPSARESRLYDLTKSLDKILETSKEAKESLWNFRPQGDVGRALYLASGLVEKYEGRRTFDRLLEDFLYYLVDNSDLDTFRWVIKYFVETKTITAGTFYVSRILEGGYSRDRDREILQELGLTEESS